MENFIKVECYKCGVVFAVSSELQGYWKRDKTDFYCVNGHRQSYIKSTADILREKLNKRGDEIFSKNVEIATLERKNKTLERKCNKKIKKKKK